MIALLIGTVEHIDASDIVILAGQVGYTVSVSSKIVAMATLGEEIRLWIYHHQTEAGSRLIGFDDLTEKQLFMRLISVNGLGPKGALALLDLGRDVVMQAIATGDAKALAQASGVGPKLASKIIVELRGSLDNQTLQNISLTGRRAVGSHFSEDDLSIVQSLVSMGYDRRAVENMMPMIPENLTGIGDRTVWCIRNLNGR